MHTWLHDLRYAARTLIKSPGFTAVAVLTLALGIGATTAIFSVVSGVLLQPLPYPEPDRIMQIWQTNDEGGEFQWSHPNFVDLREQNRSFQGLAEYSGSITVTGDEAERVSTVQVSPEFFSVLGVHPVLGRTFLFEDAGTPVVVISHGYWQRSLNSDPDVLGGTLVLGDRARTIVGVMPASLQFPAENDVWMPQELAPNPSRTAHNWRVIGRLRHGVTLEQARQELSAIARRLKQQYGDDIWMEGAAVVPLHEKIVRDVRPALLVLLGAGGFLLLIACTNVVNLLLARTASRQREFAVRLALGAGRRRLMRQLLTESLVLSLMGGALGVLLAFWGVQVLLALEPGDLPRLDEIGVSGLVLAFALAVSVLAATAIGLTAAVRATGREAAESLAGGQRTQSGGISSQRIRGALVAAQVALTLVLLVGAGLLGRSFLHLLSIDPGYRTEGAIVMDLLLPSPQDEDEQAPLARVHEELMARLRAIPGIETAGGVNVFPLSDVGAANGIFLILNRPDEVSGIEDFARIAQNPSRAGSAEYRVASAGYFRTMNIPLVRGRLFDERDDPGTPHVAVISESLAQTRWPGEDPIGKLIQFGNMDGDLRPFTIVGVVADVREQSLASEPQPTFYGYSLQRTRALGGTFSVVMSGVSDPGSIAGPARRIVHELNPDVSLRFRTLEEVFSASLADRRFSLLLLGIFAGAALLLATMGIYGLISYLVAQRTREIGIRMALGADRSKVLGQVAGQGARLVTIGLALGLVGALAATRLLQSLLYEVTATDPFTFAAVAIAVFAVAMFACYLPARRATKVDPMTALRQD